MAKSWTAEQLSAELERYEQELRAADMKDSAIQTYVDRARRFVRWLEGEYHPGHGRR